MKKMRNRTRIGTLLLGCLLLNTFVFTSCKDNGVEEVIIPVESIALNLTALRIQRGVDYQLTPVFIPENATNKQVVWSVSDLSEEGCVEIDAKTGMLKPIATGTAVVTITTIDGRLTARCNIEVVAERIPVTSITIPANHSIIKGESYTFTPAIAPEAPSNSMLTWSVADLSPEGCLTINSQTGEITAVDQGTATVTVVAADGRGAKASCSVTIKSDAIAATGISVNPQTITMEVGAAAVLIVPTILPDDATNREVVWSIKDVAPAGCATVSGNGSVSGLAAGSAIVVATIKDTDLSAECSVTIFAGTPAAGYEIVGGVWNIFNLDGLTAFRAEVSTNPAANGLLLKSIDLGSDTWVPIGSQATPYTGTFDGNGKSISNLRIIEVPEVIDPMGAGGAYKGFFGSLSGATIKNLGIESGFIDAFQYLGGIAGACSNNTTIINCYNKAKIASTKGKGGTELSCYGGIVGSCLNSTIIACYNEGEIAKSSKAPSAVQNPDAGGIVGLLDASALIGCYNWGVISQTAGPRQGGIAGRINGGCKMIGAYNAGKTVKPAPAWGLVGGGVSSLEPVQAYVGIYWVNDISGSTASAGIKDLGASDLPGTTSAQMNTQETVDAMNAAIDASGNVFATYKFVVGTGGSAFPTLITK